MAWFLTLGTACILLGFGRGWESLARASIAAVGAAVLASPWWINILARHGPGPLFAASQTGSIITYSQPTEGGPPVDPPTFITSIIAIAAFAGVIALRDQRLFPISAFGILLFLESRSFAWLSTVPLALGLGGFADHGLRLILHRDAGAAADPGPADPGSARLRARRRLTDQVINVIAVGLVVVLTFHLNGGVLQGLRLPTTVLAPEERAAMAWVAANTPPTGRFLVVTGDGWAGDRSSEWFPVLANRVSVATVQGAEWLPNREFARRIDQHYAVNDCGAQDSACLALWSMKTGKEFDYVYVADRPEYPQDKCCAKLRAELEGDPRYTRVYPGPGAAIFARR
jgi:hypothetical protein